MDYRRLIPLLAAATDIGAPPAGAPLGPRDPLEEARAALAEARTTSDRIAGHDPEAAVATFAGAALGLRRRLVVEHGDLAGGRVWEEAMHARRPPIRRRRGLHAA